MTIPETCTVDTAAAFVERFREVWTAPTLEDLDALAHPDICLTQPLVPDVRGRHRAGAYWRRVFTIVPDLHLDVIRWAISADNVVYIEFHMKGTLGRKPFAVPAVDRYVLDRTGRVRYRVLYCDPLQLAGVALRPSALVALLRAATRLGTATVRAQWGGEHR